MRVFLREFVTGPLPKKVTNPGALEDVRLLLALGCIAADMHQSCSAIIEEAK